MNDILETLSPQQRTQLRALVTEVLRVNRQFNLTAVRDPEEAWTKHVLDSLSGLNDEWFPFHRSVVDVGTGAGFPGFVLAIARPDLRVTLLEATRKKCDFLRATSANFKWPVKVMHERAEVAGRSVVWRERYDIATARAVGSLSEVCELCLPLVKVGGRVVLWRGHGAAQEIETSKRAIETLGGQYKVLCPYTLPGQDFSYHIVVIDKIAPTPEGLPRRDGLPKSEPL